MSFYRNTVRTARKEHKCDICHGVIKAGEQYHDIACNSANDESVVYWGKECMACQPVIRDFLGSSYYDSCEGYCDEYIQEWWLDVKCRECKHRWLPCVPDNVCRYEFMTGEDNHCPERTKHNTCMDGDTCDDMTHYCRCEKYEKAD
jgi:hypothetical protein